MGGLRGDLGIAGSLLGFHGGIAGGLLGSLMGNAGQPGSVALGSSRFASDADRVPGGILMATTKDVAEPKQARLTYRLKYKTKDGDRQTSHAYNVSLFP